MDIVTTTNGQQTTRTNGHSIVRVWLIDQWPTLLEGLCLILGKIESGIRVVGTSPNLDHALAHIRPDEVDVIVCGLGRASDEPVFSLLATLVNSSQGRVLVFSAEAETLFCQQLVFAGARGVVSKGESSATLAKAIRKVHEGEIWLDRHVTGSVFDALFHQRDTRKQDARLDRLTARERELLRQVDQFPGASNKEIARHLNLSENTVRNHLSSIYLKLGVSGRLALYAFAHQVATKSAHN